METNAADPTDLLVEALRTREGGFVELRYHKKRSRAVSSRRAASTRRSRPSTGVGVRVHEAGSWGFASTDQAEVGAIRRAIDARRGPRRARGRAPGASAPLRCRRRIWRAAA